MAAATIATRGPVAALRGLRKYGAAFRIQLTSDLAYPAEILSRSLVIVLFLSVFIFFWRSTYASSGQRVIAGFSLRDMLWYLAVAEAIVLSRSRVALIIAESVKDGSIVSALCKPFSLLGYQLSLSAGDSIVRATLNMAAGSALVLVVIGPPPGSPAWWIPTLVLGATGWLIDCLASVLIGLLALVTEEVAPFVWIYNKAIMLLGGLLIPLDLFPDQVRVVASHLPFAYAVYGPARFFVRPGAVALGQVVLGQLAWLAVLVAVVVLVNSLVIRRLTINGG